MKQTNGSVPVDSGLMDGQGGTGSQKKPKGQEERGERKTDPELGLLFSIY